MELRRRVRGDKVYRGAYNYYKGETLYAQEEFEVFKDRKELGITFLAELHSRVSTGELLTAYIDYTLSEDFVPQKLVVERTLGKLMVKEYYDYNPRKNHLDYIFISKKGREHVKVLVPPKFSIMTPTTSTSMLYLKTKKEDTTTRNFYPIITSTNLWTFDKEPVQKTIVAERTALASENIKIDGHNVTATPYKVYDAVNIETGEDAEFIPYVTTQISKHSTIPYAVSSQEGIKIQIRYLNNLDKD